jgi:uncharacterized protein YbjT (DUF2867 family)
MQANDSSQLPARPILVTGATGAHGGTGAFVARSLARRGHAVRALARRVDERSTALEALGIQVVVGDLRDRRALVPALAGVETAFFTFPVARGIVEAAAAFAAAGRAAGLRRVVVMSMGASHPESPSALGRAQWLAEQIVEWAGFACIHLRIAAFFFENLALLHREDVEGDGVLRNSYGDGGTSWMAAEDAARLAEAALVHPERFEGASAVYPTGAQALSHAEIARILGAHVGRPVRHETITRDAWRARLEALATRDPRINAEMADHIATLGAVMRQPLPPNDLLERVTGTTPLTIERMLETGRLSFR